MYYIWEMTFSRKNGFTSIEEVADYVRTYFGVEPTIIER